MRLLSEADRVVRTHLPAVLEAVGQEPSARRLRGLGPLSDSGSVAAACEMLRAVQILPVSQEIWGPVVRDASLWCEAAVWAAIRGDAQAFRHHVDRATAAMRSGLPPSSLN